LWASSWDAFFKLLEPNISYVKREAFMVYVTDI